MKSLTIYHLFVFTFREVATITYRSGPEWEERFGRQRIDSNSDIEPNFCPEFEIESYLDYQVLFQSSLVLLKDILILSS